MISCFAGYIFYNDIISAMEKYCKDLTNSVMEKAGAICRNLNTTDVGLLMEFLMILIISVFLPLLFVLMLCASVYDNGFVQIKMERIVGSGDPKDVICSAVQKLEADTLVMGTHGYGFFKRYCSYSLDLRSL